MVHFFFDTQKAPELKEYIQHALDFAVSIMPNHNYLSAARLPTTAHALAFGGVEQLIALRNNCPMDPLEIVCDDKGFDGEYPKKTIALVASPQSTISASIALPHKANPFSLESWKIAIEEFNSTRDSLSKILAVMSWEE